MIADVCCEGAKRLGPASCAGRTRPGWNLKLGCWSLRNTDCFGSQGTALAHVQDVWLAFFTTAISRAGKADGRSARTGPQSSGRSGSSLCSCGWPLLCQQRVSPVVPCRAALSGLAALPALLAAAPALALGKDVKKAMAE